MNEPMTQTIPPVDAADTRQQELCTRLVRRRCGDDASLVLAQLGIGEQPPGAPKYVRAAAEREYQKQYQRANSERLATARRAKREASRAAS